MPHNPSVSTAISSLLSACCPELPRKDLPYGSESPRYILPMPGSFFSLVPRSHFSQFGEIGDMKFCSVESFSPMTEQILDWISQCHLLPFHDLESRTHFIPLSKILPIPAVHSPRREKKKSGSNARTIVELA